MKASILIAFALCAPAAAKQGRAIPDMAEAGPAPADYQAKVKAFLADRLKDPDSAKVEEVRGPRVASHQVDRGFLGHLWDDPAWWVCYRVNAKNSYGGFTGAHLYQFAFADGAIRGVKVSPFPGYGGKEWETAEVEEECALAADSTAGTGH